MGASRDKYATEAPNSVVSGLGQPSRELAGALRLSDGLVVRESCGLRRLWQALMACAGRLDPGPQW